ncbi:MAG TPA: hypothetical protein PLM75_02055 [bacterium]|nr:hypothetical protein [bacterium]
MTYSETSYFTVVYDNIPPVFSDNIQNTIYTTIPTIITITGTDNLTGIDTIQYRINSGAWFNGNTITIDTDGLYYIQYRGYDGVGNLSAILDGAYPVLLDTAKPQPVNVYDEGNISADTIIEFFWDLPIDSSPIVNYYVQVDSSTLFVTPIFESWTNSASLFFRISGDSGIINGETYYCRVRSKDAVGNISDYGAASDGIYIDTAIGESSKPEPPSIDSHPLWTRNSIVTLTGTKTDTEKYIFVNNSLADISGNNWSRVVILNFGNNILTLTSKNEYGETSDPVSINIYMDNISPTRPTFNVVSPTNQDTQLIIGQKASDAETVWVNGNLATIISDTLWQYTISLTNEINIVEVTSSDTFGNISETVSNTIIYDTVPPIEPTVNYISPYSGYEQIVSGTYDTVATVLLTVNNIAASLNSVLGIWNFTCSLLNEETNTFTIRAIDAAGNISTRIFYIVRDTLGPAAPNILSPFNNADVFVSPITVSGTVPADAVGVIINNITDNNISPNDTFAVNVPLTIGNNPIIAYAIDSLGNKSSPTVIVVNYNPLAFKFVSEQLDNNEILNNITDSLIVSSNNQINFSTITNTTVILTYNNVSKNYSIIPSPDSYSFYIVPAEPFLIHRTYKLELTTDIKNVNGINLGANKIWLFRTGTDDTKPVIVSFQTLDPNGNLLIDASDTGILLRAIATDTDIGIDYLRFELGVNNPRRDDYNFTFMDVGQSTANFQKLFTATLNVDDTIYTGIFIADLAGNTVALYETKTVGAVIVPEPQLKIGLDTTVSYTPILLEGTKVPEVSVFINGNQAINIDTDKWRFNLSLNPGINNFTIFGRIANSVSPTRNHIVIYDVTLPTATDNAPSVAVYDSRIITITGIDEQSGIKRTLYSLNGGSWTVGNTVLISNEYENILRYVVENNCELYSDTYTKKIYIDRTRPEPVYVTATSRYSFDTTLVWSWETPFDSSQIVNYIIQIADDTSFANLIIFDTVAGNINFIVAQNNNFQDGKTYYCRIAAKDIAGNVSNYNPAYYEFSAITIDTNLANQPSPDTPIILMPANGIETNAANILVRGIKDTDATIVLVNGLSATIIDSTTWTRVIPLNILGANTIYVSVKNIYGKESPETYIVVYFNNVPPAVPIITTTRTLTNSETIVISGIREPGSFIAINGSTLGISFGYDTFAKTFIQPEGQTTYNVVSFDTLGNYSNTATITITVDKTPPARPTATFTSPTNNSYQLISGTLESGASLSVNGNTEQVLIFGTLWQFPVSLSEGANTFTVISRDLAGNASDTVFVIILDTIAPEKPKILYPPNGYKTSASSIIISGIKPKESFVYINGVIAENNNYMDTQWSTTYNMLAGSNLITATARDNLGNVSDFDQIIVTFDINLFLVEVPILEDNEFIMPTNKIDIHLNKQLDTNSLNTDNIYLLNSQGQRLIPENLLYNSATNVISVYYPLAPSKSYQLFISRNLTDINSVKLPQNRTYNFTVLINKDTETIINNDEFLSIFTPQNALSNNAYFVINELSTNDALVLVADAKIDFAGYMRNLGAYRKIYRLNAFETNGNSINSFLIPLLLKINYADNNNDGILDNTTLKTKFLDLYYLDTNDNTWKKLTNSFSDTINKYVSSDLSKPAIFTVFGGYLDADTKVMFIDSLNNVRLKIYNPETNDAYIKATEINPYDNAKVIAADNKLLSESGFVKSLGIARNVYEIKAYNSADQIIANFNEPMILYLGWADINNDGIIDNTDVEEKYVTIYRLNEANNIWEKIPTQVDATNNLAYALLNHFSIYTLFGVNYSSGQILFYPNPTMNKKINLLAVPQVSNILSLTIINPFGRIVYQNQFNVTPGIENHITNIDLSKLPVGGYYAKIIMDGIEKILGVGIAK